MSRADFYLWRDPYTPDVKLKSMHISPSTTSKHTNTTRMVLSLGIIMYIDSLLPTNNRVDAER